MNPKFEKFQLPYIYGLDVVRFLCALMVATFHLSWRNAGEGTYHMPFGWIGVQIFFVISGVVIANSAASTSPFRFLKGRFLRLYPAAWIAALVNGAILTIVPHWKYESLGINVIPHADAFVNSLFLFGGPYLASSYWTLPIELAFYAIVFASMFAGRADRFKMIARTLVIVSTSYLLLLFLGAAYKWNAPWLDLGYGLKNVLLVRHGAYFAIGIYFWMIHNGRSLNRADYFSLGAGVCASMLEISCRAIELAEQFTTTNGTAQWSPETLSIVACAVFFCFAGSIFLSLRHAATWVPAGVMKSWLRTVGLMTYPFYLIHEVTGGAVLHQAVAAGVSPAVSLCFALISVSILAHFIARRLEPIVRQLLSKPINWVQASSDR